jgi:Domain of unknown function (DUF1735)
MKRVKNDNKFIVTGYLLLSITFFQGACVKDRPGETNFSQIQPIVLIPEGGLSTFSSEALVFPATDASDTANFHVNYAAVNVASADETVTLAVDAAAVTSYNSSSAIQYVLAPDSIFSFTTNTVTVTKGDNYTGNIPLVIYPSKVDPTKNYMIPISIETAPTGATISGNYGTIYYHLIGNPIAGTYEEYWSRWNAADSSSGAAGALYYQSDVGAITFGPNSPTEIAAVSQGTGETDIIDFTNTAGTLSNFTVTIPPVTGITVGSPSFVRADPVNGIYEIYFSYVNGSGANRVIVDKYVKK